MFSTENSHQIGQWNQWK